MARLSEPIPSERALVPTAPRGLAYLRRALPVSRQMALGIAASAVGTIFVKRLVELAAEDVYRRVRHLPRNFRLRRRADVPEKRQVEELPQAEPIPLPPSSALFVRVVRVWRVTASEQDFDS